MTYAWLGTTHILLGIDHLLFVTALVVMLSDRGRLLAAVTAFSIGHTLSLGVVAAGFMTVPRLAEAAIALSVLFVATEMFRARRGVEPMIARRPWIACGAIGLLHGLGFAGAFESLGLGAAEIPAALASFTAGIEAGQLGIVALALVAGHAWRTLDVEWPHWAEDAPALAVASAALLLLVGTLL